MWDKADRTFERIKSTLTTKQQQQYLQGHDWLQ